MKHLKISNSKWTVKHLPALAAAVAVTLALAFTPRTVDDGFAQDPDTGDWIPLAPYTIGEDYECVDEGNCKYELPDTTSEVLDEGTFRWK
ncbi:hypothetical protein [Membranihabitans maritimus]|uniref:hypothetical protein n=1 Tax=Membranihabitans maritimus TaxID=2904244 RepID=UPI001F19EEBB|nr:hypothetical protein [Membranihabitans maritimus]